MVIREMTIEDYDRVIALWSDCEGIGLSEADSRAGILKFLQRNPGTSCVAEERDEIVGAALCGNDGRRGHIHHLAVRQGFRRLGLGRRLVAACLSRLKAADITKCHVFVFAENEDGVAFWSHIGWLQRCELRVISRFTTKEEGG